MARLMRVKGTLFVLIALGASPMAAAPLELTFATYLGGRTGGFTLIRDVVLDAQGNAYVTGGTASTDFPTTPGAYQRSFGGGPMDVFVVKLNPRGQIVWSTFLGGPEYDRAYAVEVDGEGFVYVAGRVGRRFPTTGRAFQQRFDGWSGGEPYRWNNAFVAKLAPDGSRLTWGSYFGNGQLIRDIDLDANGDIYVHATTGHGGAGKGSDYCRCAAIDPMGNFIVAGESNSTDWPSLNGLRSGYPAGPLAKFSAVRSGASTRKE